MENFMKNFKNISALHSVLSEVYSLGEGEVGRNVFPQWLQENLELNEGQAELYSSTVLTKNSNGSADWVMMNGYKVVGKWTSGNMDGSAGNLLVSKTETWQFNEDLTYQHKNESYEGYVSPFGGSYSRPSSSSELGIWAPSDRLEDEFCIIAISQSGRSRSIRVKWLGATKINPVSCTLDGARFARQ